MTEGLITSRMINPTEPVEDIQWVAPGFAARGYLTVLAGQAGIGKSTLALQVAAAVGTPEAPALYLDIENGPTHLRRLTQAMELDAGVDLVDMHGLALTETETLDRLTAELLGRGIAALARHGVMGAPLVVLDSLRRFAPGRSENSSDDMAPYVASLTTLARRTQAALLLIHHASSKPDAPPLRGSTAIQDQADIVLTLTEHREAIKLACAKCRPAATPAPIYYQRRLDPLRLVQIDTPSASRAKARESCEEEVLAALADGPLSISEAARRIGRNPTDRTVRRALVSLEREGAIVRRNDKTYLLVA